MNRSRPAAPWLAVLRVLGAGLLAAMAGIHLYLWSNGYAGTSWIGPLFLANVVAGVLLGIAVLAVSRRGLAVVAALGALLQGGTLGALILSVWIGLFGFVESTRATLFWPSMLVESAGAVVLAVLAAWTYVGDRVPAHAVRTADRVRSAR